MSHVVAMSAAEAAYEADASPCEIESVELNADFARREAMLAEEWHKLFARDTTASIFHHLEYAAKESAQFPAGNRLPSFIVTAREEGELTVLGAAVPKSLPVRGATALVLGNRLHGYRLVANRLLGDALEETQVRLVESLAEQVRARGGEFLLVEDLEDTSTLWTHLHDLRRKGFELYAPTGVHARRKIRMPATLEEFWGRMSSKTRSNFRRNQKKFTGGTLRVVREVDQIEDFLRLAHQVSLNTWQTECLGLRIHNNAAEAELLKFLARQGTLRSYLLLQGERPVAFVLGNQFRRYFNFEEFGFDRDFTELSPGTHLLLAVVEEMYRHDTPEWFDFGGGDAEYKRGMANTETCSACFWLIPPGSRAAWAMRSQIAYQRVKKLGGNLLKQAGLFAKVRHFLRRGQKTHS